MGIIEINAYNLDKYFHILGADMAENVGRTKFFAISSDEKGESVLVWRFITSQSGVPTSDIVFFKADRKSSGKELLLECVKVSSEHGIKNYHITIDYAIDIEMGLLKNFGFTLKRVESRDVLTTISGITLDRLKVLDKDVKPIALKDLTYPEYRQQLTECLMKDKRGLEDDVADLPMRWYDQDVSCSIMHGDWIEGLLLVHRLPSGVLRPTFLYSNGMDPARDMLVMIRFAVEEAMKKYSPDTPIRVTRRLDEIRILSDKLFREKRIFEVLEGEACFNL